jgi:hypothetical protein
MLGDLQRRPQLTFDSAQTLLSEGGDARLGGESGSGQGDVLNYRDLDQPGRAYEPDVHVVTKGAAMRSRLRSAAAARLGRPSAMPSASVEETTRTYRRLEGFRGPAR